LEDVGVEQALEMPENFSPASLTRIQAKASFEA
jgi:hypothetical protein